ncbi:MAG TPA: threonine synthase [Burkholderiales bacterium]|nr:threonine synthase [Burkholderiales bacterium]
MQYISTRGEAPARRFSEILLEGLAPDGGLYVPAEFPKAKLSELRGKSYADLACAILGLFIDEVPELEALVRRAYSARVFGSADITPLKTLEPGLHLLGLSNGPTLAFKDIALQLLGGLFEQSLSRRNDYLRILGATSGDTGSAAEHAMRGKPRIQIFMLSPHNRMSPFQRAQMFSLQDANIHNLAVEGVFDDCQDLVKAVNADAAFKERQHIGAVNSINWARVAAQVVYYFKGYFAATSSDAQRVSFAVPSGNFGNIYAGYVAHRMGLPVRRLVLATNENDVLDRFFRTGKYQVRKSAKETSSPSMDISRASNFERYAFELAGRDGARVRGLWRRLAETGEIDLSGAAFTRDPVFASGKSTHADRLSVIRKIFEKYGTMIDPHTADGVKVGLEHREPAVPMICLETALPAKFAETIRAALGREPERPAELAGLEKLPQRFRVIPNDVGVLKRIIESA